MKPKICNKCGEEKELDEFVKDKNKQDGHRGECKQCARIRYRDSNKDHRKKYTREYRITNREHIREYNKKYGAEYYRSNENLRNKQRSRILKSKYGIDNNKYSEMLYLQGGVCAICKRQEIDRDKVGNIKVLAVDHRETIDGVIIVRELLCRKCNTGLGCFGDSPTLLRIAADYLEKHLALER